MKELKEFLKFKKEYKFEFKEIEEKNGVLYCEGAPLQDAERKQN